ncbi:MAG: T9SS type A sorting domain-containing protein [Fibrobacter sp.]|nr:T9SS type A sorting domain-containing protein [Fibrobacter sp.]
MNKKLTLAIIAAGAAMASAQLAPTFIWDGSDTEGRVITGSDDEKSGYWYDYNDENDGGDSKFVWPSDVEPNAYDNFYGPLCEAYGGIKGTASIGTGAEFPYLGLGFNLVNEEQDGGDISAWGGICLTYSSTGTFKIEIGVPNEKAVTGYNNYVAAVSKQPSVGTQNYPWSKFKQATGWGTEVDQAVVLGSASAIKLKFEASADFLIQEIGSNNQCGNGSLPTPAIEKGMAAQSFKAQLSGRTLSFGKTVAKAEIINLQGQVVMAASSVKSMDLSKVQAGVYMVRAEGMSQQIMVK